MHIYRKCKVSVCIAATLLLLCFTFRMNRISYFPAVLNTSLECKKLNIPLGNRDVLHSSDLRSHVAKINSGKKI